jgi:hypothetical protein
MGVVRKTISAGGNARLVAWVRIFVLRQRMSQAIQFPLPPERRGNSYSPSGMLPRERELDLRGTPDRPVEKFRQESSPARSGLAPSTTSAHSGPEDTSLATFKVDTEFFKAPSSSKFFSSNNCWRVREISSLVGPAG